ncbi:hypothetical protein PI126_g23515 [Phytophthora idaei]|nr:hypothetical protein PI126_g23515 [Phytophthora idaei]
MAMGSALLQNEQHRVALAISKLGGRPREWALTCGTSVDAAFPTWAQLKQQLSRMFASPNQAYRIRSRFLATRQGKKELLDYVRASCPVRNQRKAPPSQASGSSRGNGDSQ